MEVKAKTSRGRNTAAVTGDGLAMTAMERKEVERWRRQQMKGLCAKLASLIPRQHYYCSKQRMTQLEILDAAVEYIKELNERVDGLERKRGSTYQLVATTRGGGASTPAAIMESGSAGLEEANEEAIAAPVMVVRHQPQDGSSLDISLVSSVERPLKLHEMITVLEEEGAEVINANLSVAGRKIFCSIHSRVPAHT